jgi:hypothetical protein
VVASGLVRTRMLITLLLLATASLRAARGQHVNGVCLRDEEFYDAVLGSCQSCHDVCKACNIARSGECITFCISNCREYFGRHYTPDGYTLTVEQEVTGRTVQDEDGGQHESRVASDSSRAGSGQPTRFCLSRPLWWIMAARALVRV